MKKRAWLVALLTLFLVLAAAGCGKGGGEKAAPAEKKIDFPTKAVNITVGFGAGGSVDMTARTLAEQMQKILGQPVVVVNKPGAGGGLGAAEVTRAKADGYSLYNGTSGPITLIPYQQNVGYTYKDFKAVARIVDCPNALTVTKDSKYKTVAEFMDYAKKNPGKLRVATTGAGTTQDVFVHQIKKDFGIEVKAVPYEGSQAEIKALLGGEIDAMLSGFTDVTPRHKSGELKVLGVSTDKRLDGFLPDVPTFKEAGYDVLNGYFVGVFAPKDTPKEIIDILAKAAKQSTETGEFKSLCNKLYLKPAYLGPDEFSALVEKDSLSGEKWMKEMGLYKKS